MRHVVENRTLEQQQPITNIVYGKPIDTTPRYITKDGMFFIKGGYTIENSYNGKVK